MKFIINSIIVTLCLLRQRIFGYDEERCDDDLNSSENGCADQPEVTYSNFYNSCIKAQFCEADRNHNSKNRFRTFAECDMACLGHLKKYSLDAPQTEEQYVAAVEKFRTAFYPG
ncbi:hypothetical protein M5D96_003548 [Drosophila gunungcola]|uniref:Seminal fluid protein n=1 Tax=Drosophila gunungcola TaxID=103775 RepID=A0A9Q0BS77_9MUSC|nr:hypothetical protein M5D96_003548 [Drosophila gunungcola]